TEPSDRLPDRFTASTTLLPDLSYRSDRSSDSTTDLSNPSNHSIESTGYSCDFLVRLKEYLARFHDRVSGSTE
ncbi:MAG TPA: hypothetical protein VKT80_03675, partial [Chloroflexota bacterium]|nr:hypothetical protein [Chloroflexota bacterium]